MKEYHSGTSKTSSMDLVNGSIAKTLMLFSFPFMLSTLLQTAYSTTDTIIVGQFLQQEGLSAVSTGSQIMQMMYSVCIGFSNAGQVLIAQAKGAGQHEKLERIIGTLFLLEIFLSILVGGICVVFSGGMLHIMNIPAEAYIQAKYYIVICGIGVLFTGLYNMFSAVLRGMGDSRHPLLFVVIATVLNIMLDIFFVAVLHWNVAGTALATVLGQFVSVVFSFVFLLKHADAYGIRFGRNSMHVDLGTARQLTIIGFPFAVQMTAVQVSFLFVGRMINALGVTVSAAFGVMQKIRSIPSFITQGFGLGAASMIGQNLGARKMDRVSSVVKYCILFTAVIDIVIGGLYLLAPMFWFRIFTQDADVLNYAALIMLVLAIEVPANCFMPACNGLVSAQGFVQLSFVVAMLDAFLGRIFFCWLLGSFFHLQALGYFLGYVLGTYITSMIVLFYYASGWWRKRAALV
ncbi:MAG: MATE family efflux transporter [Lachnospiraceae bacterium]|nr:MATE family efflux transporter [Lachnospiraceae bacterium]